MATSSKASMNKRRKRARRVKSLPLRKVVKRVLSQSLSSPYTGTQTLTSQSLLI